MSMEIYLKVAEVLKGIDQPVLMEIGAHWGQDTVELRRLFPQGKIWMFEPDPRNIYKIKQGLVDKAATLIEAAIGDHDGTADFLLSSGTPPKNDPHYVPSLGSQPWTFSSSLKKPVTHLKNVPWVKFEHRAKVKVMKLDTFVRQAGIEAIDFIWADVQGAEDQMIAGGQEAFAKTSYLYTEYAEEELYEGQISLAEIVKRLPGTWDVVQDYGNDVLLRNATKLGPMSAADKLREAGGGASPDISGGSGGAA